MKRKKRIKTKIINGIEVRYCKYCNQDKIYDTFIGAKCKNCYDRIRREQYAKNPEPAKKRAKHYNNTHKEEIARYHKEYRIKNKNTLSEKNKIYRQNNKDIIKQKKHIYYENNKDYIKNKTTIWSKNNIDKIKKSKKKYKDKNINKIRKDGREYYHLNKHKIDKNQRLQNQRKFREKNIKSIRIKKNEYEKNKRENNINYKLRTSVSHSIYRILKSNASSKMGRSLLDFLPYSISDLKIYLENKFELWMNWKNWGTYKVSKWNDNDPSTWTWQIDHIIPQYKLPYSSMEDGNFQKCWALENLRPFSAKANIIKGKK